MRPTPGATCEAAARGLCPARSTAVGGWGEEQAGIAATEAEGVAQDGRWLDRTGLGDDVEIGLRVGGGVVGDRRDGAVPQRQDGRDLARAEASSRAGSLRVMISSLAVGWVNTLACSQLWPGSPGGAVSRLDTIGTWGRSGCGIGGPLETRGMVISWAWPIHPSSESVTVSVRTACSCPCRYWWIMRTWSGSARSTLMDRSSSRSSSRGGQCQVLAHSVGAVCRWAVPMRLLTLAADLNAGVDLPG